MVEQEVDDDAGDGYVEPNGESPAGDATMKFKLLTQGAANGDENHRHNRDSENRVADQQREIDRADIALALESNGAHLEMVNHIGDKEGGAAHESGNHAGPVHVDATASDGQVAGKEKQGAGGVEAGVERGVGEQGR